MTIRKHDWLMVAMQSLLEHGLDSITIAGLTERLQVTKGSFYHHFSDMADFKAQMLALCIEESLSSIEQQTRVGATPYDRLRLLESMAAATDAMEVALRAWALRDDQARQALIELDAKRLAYIDAVFRENAVQADAAAEASRLFYALFIGGQHILPPLNSDQMQAGFDLLREHFGVKKST